MAKKATGGFLGFFKKGYDENILPECYQETVIIAYGYIALYCESKFVLRINLVIYPLILSPLSSAVLILILTQLLFL